MFDAEVWAYAFLIDVTSSSRASCAPAAGRPAETAPKGKTWPCS
jgi:hypothetical protein